MFGILYLAPPIGPGALKAISEGTKEMEGGNWWWGAILIGIGLIAIIAWAWDGISDFFGSSSTSTPSSNPRSTSISKSNSTSSNSTSSRKPHTRSKGENNQTVYDKPRNDASSSSHWRQGAKVTDEQRSASSNSSRPSNTQRTPDGCLSIGTRLRNGQFVIREFISNGGFGNTYLAEDIHNGGYNIAIKEFFKRDICSRVKSNGQVLVTIGMNRQQFVDLKDKFIREARRLMRLNHRNIIKVFEVFEENGTAYYTMEYIKGPSLKEYVKKNGPLDEWGLRNMMPGLLSAVNKIHLDNIWHLDIKPANIMLRDTNEPVLIDFGSSKQYYDNEGHSVYNSTVIPHTPGYAPMEQLMQDKDRIGSWTDVYALGATFYAVVTGKTPPSPSIIEEDGLDLPNHIYRTTADNIRKMMTPARRHRPQSVEQVAGLFNIQLNY